MITSDVLLISDNIANAKLQTHIIFNEADDVSNHSDFIKYFSKDQYIPKEKDKIYITTKCSIPRFKLKEFCKKYKVKIVRDIEKANVIIISDNSIEKLFKHDKAFYYNYYNINEQDQDSTKEFLVPIIEKFPNTIYFGVYRYGYNSVFSQTSMVKNIRELDLKVSSGNFNYIIVNEDSEKVFSSLQTCDVYDESAILKYLNSNILDYDKYISIQRLLKSSHEDRDVAIETIANCDYQKSCVYLLLLLKDYGHYIYDRSASHHVNFKAFLSYFNLSRRDLRSFTLHDILNSLKERKLLNKSNFDILFPHVKKEMDYHNQYSDYLTVSKFNYTENLEKAIDENVLDKHNDTIIIDFEDDEEINPHI